MTNNQIATEIQSISDKELWRHARVSIHNNCPCEKRGQELCYCCKCKAELKRRNPLSYANRAMQIAFPTTN